MTTDSTLWTETTRHGPTPPMPVTHYGVAFGPKGGCIVSARWEPGYWPGVSGYETFGPSLRAIGDRVRQLLDTDHSCVVVIDGGLHGPDLRAYLADLRMPHRRLSYFETARPELRRAELGGRLRAAWEQGHFGIKRIGAGALALRGAIGDAAREDAADRVEVSALSLAVVDRRRPAPRIG